MRLQLLLNETGKIQEGWYVGRTGGSIKSHVSIQLETASSDGLRSRRSRD